jgi:hypothetical protein
MPKIKPGGFLIIDDAHRFLPSDSRSPNAHTHYGSRWAGLGTGCCRPEPLAHDLAQLGGQRHRDIREALTSIIHRCGWRLLDSVKSRVRTCGDGHAGLRIAAAWPPGMGWQPDLVGDTHLACSPAIADVVFLTERI